MKRLLLFFTVILLVASGVSLTAFDVGGSLTSGTSYSSLGTGVLDNEEAIGLWLESGKGDYYSFETKIDLIVSATGGAFYINPDYLKLDGLFMDLEYGPDILATSLGRFTASDFSGKVFSQKLDGLLMSFKYPAFDLTLTAGYTGLFFTETGTLLTSSPSTIISKTDASDALNSTSLFEALTMPSEAGKAVLQSPRAVEMITLTLPQLFMRQDLTFSLVAQEDMRPVLDLLGGTSTVLTAGEENYYANLGGPVDTQYFGAGISGPSIDSLYHKVYYYLGTGRALSYKADSTSSTGSSYSYDNILAHMAGFSLDYYLTEFLYSIISLSGTWSTGDADATGYLEGNTSGDYNQFQPITSGGGGIIFSPGITNIISLNAGYSLKPFIDMGVPFIENAQVAVNIIPFIKAGVGPTSNSQIISSNQGNYLGSEIDLTLNMRPYSDLGIITQVGCFLPDATAFTAGSTYSQPVFMAKLNVSLSF